MNKGNTLLSILQRLHEGESLEALASEIETIGDISPDEWAKAEDLLANSGVSIDEIQRLSTEHTNLAEKVITTADAMRVDKIPGHPAFVFIGENKGLSLYIESAFRSKLSAYVASLSDADLVQLKAETEVLERVILHYDRKENVFFPYLENAGITVPPQVMWGVDDVIRSLLGVLKQAVSEDPANATRIDLVANRVLTQIEEMIVKENEVLMPMLLTHMKEADWVLAAQESTIIGYVFNQGIEGASNSDAQTWLNAHLGEKEALPEKEEGKIQLPSGNLTVEQLNAMLNTLPTDLTFTDENDIIQYYSEGKHQVFTRTRTIIGRDLYLCHPPALVPTIKKLIGEFRSGEKDEEVVAIRKGNLINLVRYYAVRDGEGKYMGCVEVTEEISGTLEMLNL